MIIQINGKSLIKRHLVIKAIRFLTASNDCYIKTNKIDFEVSNNQDYFDSDWRIITYNNIIDRSHYGILNIGNNYSTKDHDTYSSYIINTNYKSKITRLLTIGESVYIIENNQPYINYYAIIDEILSPFLYRVRDQFNLSHIVHINQIQPIDDINEIIDIVSTRIFQYTIVNIKSNDLLLKQIKQVLTKENIIN